MAEPAGAVPAGRTGLSPGGRIGHAPAGPSPRRSAADAPPLSGVGGRSVLEGAFALLEAVEWAREAGLTRLSSECGLPKTTAYGLLEQMVALGAVERQGTGYRMGPRLFRLAREWQPHPRLRSAASGPVRQLARATGATVGLAVLRRGQTLVLDWTPGETSGALAAQYDRVTWPWFTAAGKVLVAEGRSDMPLGPMPASWHQQAAMIRERGAAFDREEVAEGVCCAAVPLYDVSRVLVAALFVATDPAHHLERLADVAHLSGRAISRALRGR
ncbi:IclR family transcriptional regulator [Streptomyces lincolnensis]|uniref:IclR family transcriptional regulator n=1 Tax=Streptomyces lincolnensis TaxID=1915 RepID=UPI0037D723B6